MNPEGPQPPPTPMVPQPSEPANGTRNVVIGMVVVVVVLLIVAAIYSATQPSVLQPTVVPSGGATATPIEEVIAEPTETPTATPTEEPTRTPKATPTEVAFVSEAPESEPPVTEEPRTEPPATEQATLPPFSPEPSFGLPDQGIALTSPVLLGDPSTGTAVVAALAWNLTPTVNTYTLKGEFSNGRNTTATAAGQVTDQRPGDLRTVQLMIDSGTPSATDTLSIALDEMISQDPSTDTSDVASQVTFGTPMVTTGVATSIGVDVTNGSDQQATLTIAAGVMREGALVGIATGTIDLAAGQTGAVTMPVTGQAESTDFILLDVDSVVIG